MKKGWKIFSSIILGITILMTSLVGYQLVRINSVDYDWLDGEPEDHGFKWNKIAATYLVADRMPYIRSVLISRNGTLLTEWYFNDGDRTTEYTIHSASKSVTSALVGIAIQEGFLLRQDLDSKMLDFFPEFDTPDLDPRKQNITVRHLLQMRAGLNFNDSEEDWNLYFNSPNWVEYAINLPLAHDPGQSWHYSTPQTNLLAVILAKVTHMNLKEFAEHYLFDPLNITINQWFRDPQGYYVGGHEMYFSPREMLQFGLLYLNNGSIDGNQILSEDWVKESLQNYSNGEIETDIAMTGGLKSEFYAGTGYGYQWWLKDIRGFTSFSARGLGGQFIFCFPELNLVIVTTASGSVSESYPRQYEGMVDLIEYNIMGSVLETQPTNLKEWFEENF